MPSIGFLSPLFLAGLLAVAVPIALHLLRRRIDPVVPFSAVRLLRQAPVEHKRRRRLEDLLLLALRVAAILLLALAFARPYLVSSETHAALPVTAVFVDVSASLDAPARFALAQRLARQAVDEAPAGHAVALGRFDVRADLLVAPTTDRAVARVAIDGLRPSASATRYAAAVARGADAIAGRGGRLVLITDLQTAGWDASAPASLPPDVAVEVHDVGELPANAGIIEVARTPTGVRAAIRNAGPARTIPLTVQVEGAPPVTQEIALPAGAVEVAELALELPARGALRATLDDPEGLAADNTRWLVLDPRPARHVRVIAAPGAQQRDALYLTSALRAMAPPRSFEVDVVAADRVTPERVAEGVSVVAVLGTAGLDRRATERLQTFVQEGGGLFVAVGPALNIDLLAAGLGDLLPRVRIDPAAAAPRSLAAGDLRHPVFRVFAGTPGAFDTVKFTRVASLLGTTGSRVLARFDGGAPALVEQPAGLGRVCVLASDVGNRWNDFALHPVFVPFVVETFTWLAGGLEPPRAVAPGETGLAGTDQPGTIEWRLPGSDEEGARVAVNVDPREFEPARESADAFERRLDRRTARDVPGREAARRQEAEQGLWRYGLGLMLLSLVVESVIGRRG